MRSVSLHLNPRGSAFWRLLERVVMELGCFSFQQGFQQQHTVAMFAGPVSELAVNSFVSCLLWK